MRIIRRVVALNDVRQRACKNSSSLPTHPRFACRSSRSLHLASNVNVRTSLITNISSLSLKRRTQAQVDMIDKLLDFSSLDGSKISSVVDVGCGIGGSSRHIAKKYNCEAKGVTLSPYQAKRGNELAEEQGLKGKASFQVADALSMPFPDSSFDLVWSLESGEHMPDKEKFVGELTRVAKKGSSVILCTWVHRDLEEGEELTKKEVR